MEPIIFSNHAEKQMELRGADKEEVEKTILEGKKGIAKYGKLQFVYIRF